MEMTESMHQLCQCHSFGGIVLISFTEIFMVLYLGFLINIVLIIYQCFSCCRALLTQSYGLFYFSCCPAIEEAGGA